MVKVAPWVFAVALALALAGCAPEPAPNVVAETTHAAQPTSPKPTPTEKSPEPAESAEPPPSGPDCINSPTGRILRPNSMPRVPVATLRGELIDTGANDFASGDPTLNDAGEIFSYEVQEGDTAYAIALRFCLDQTSLVGYNKIDYYDMQPGDVLILRP